jgi:HAMP domain-containing protein
MQNPQEATTLWVWIATGLISLGTLAYFVMAWLTEYLLRAS